MAENELNAVFKKVVEESAKSIAHLGFKRNGLKISKCLDGNCALIEFQKSRDNTADRIKFTINLAVICGKLLELFQPPLEKAGSADSHFWNRSGGLLGGEPDKWWELTPSTNEKVLMNEISSLVREKAAPYVLQYVRSDALIQLWKSGKSPGLTHKQRLQYLKRLEGDASTSQ